MNTSNNLDESPENYAEWKKRILKGFILYDSDYITSLNWENCRNEEQINGCQGLRRVGGWERSGYSYKRATWGSLADRNVLYLGCDTVLVLSYKHSEFVIPSFLVYLWPVILFKNLKTSLFLLMLFYFYFFEIIKIHRFFLIWNWN